LTKLRQRKKGEIVIGGRLHEIQRSKKWKRQHRVGKEESLQTSILERTEKEIFFVQGTCKMFQLYAKKIQNKKQKKKRAETRGNKNYKVLFSMNGLERGRGGKGGG